MILNLLKILVIVGTIIYIGWAFMQKPTRRLEWMKIIIGGVSLVAFSISFFVPQMLEELLFSIAFFLVTVGQLLQAYYPNARPTTPVTLSSKKTFRIWVLWIGAVFFAVLAIISAVQLCFS